MSTPPSEGRFNNKFPTLANICKNEKIEIRHESLGCFHHYEDVFEVSGNTPLKLDAYRLHPNGRTLELDVVEEKGTVELKQADVDKANIFIAQYLNIGSQKDCPPPGIISTTEDKIRLLWYRDGEIVEEISVMEYQGSFPFLREILYRAGMK